MVAGRGITGFCLLVLAACTPVTVAPEANRPERFAAWTVEVAEYRFRPGDEIDIRLTYNPEYSDRVTVAPDGRIAMPLIGGLKAEGLTAAELERDLIRRYARDLRRPELTVVPRSFGSQKVFVGGEVNQQGVQALPGRIGVLEAILLAGGAKTSGQLKEVGLIRRNSEGKPMLRTVNVEALMSTGDPAQDVPLQPFDIVYVPRSSIAELGLFIDQYIRQVLPFDRGFSYSISTGN